MYLRWELAGTYLKWQLKQFCPSTQPWIWSSFLRRAQTPWVSVWAQTCVDKCPDLGSQAFCGHLNIAMTHTWGREMATFQKAQLKTEAMNRDGGLGMAASVMQDALPGSARPHCVPWAHWQTGSAPPRLPYLETLHTLPVQSLLHAWCSAHRAGSGTQVPLSGCRWCKMK